ncbi:uncharacterized protein C2845_PM12G15120 [Panicum miliaceum]|uniref:Uncharacterized protein n=1 Tax=Panicum miliaceum TaxID=4540 RepID=A0A3L6QDU3_PANMI|nr:uncharacterized protein C2845_PM12G15120 [Panicum miliaceum]
MKKATRYLKQLFAAVVAAVKSTAVGTRASSLRTRLIVLGIMRNKKLLLSAIQSKIHAIMGGSGQGGHSNAVATHGGGEGGTTTEGAGRGGAGGRLLLGGGRKAAVLQSLPSFVVEQESRAVVLSSLPSFALERDGGAGLARSPLAGGEEVVEYNDGSCEKQAIAAAGSAVEGEFRLEDEIDRVADVFIRRFHDQMKLQKLESFKSQITLRIHIHPWIRRLLLPLLAVTAVSAGAWPERDLYALSKLKSSLLSHSVRNSTLLAVWDTSSSSSDRLDWIPQQTNNKQQGQGNKLRDRSKPPTRPRPKSEELAGSTKLEEEEPLGHLGDNLAVAEIKEQRNKFLEVEQPQTPRLWPLRRRRRRCRRAEPKQLPPLPPRRAPFPIVLFVGASGDAGARLAFIAAAADASVAGARDSTPWSIASAGREWRGRAAPAGRSGGNGLRRQGGSAWRRAMWAGSARTAREEEMARRRSLAKMASGASRMASEIARTGK